MPTRRFRVGHRLHRRMESSGSRRVMGSFGFMGTGTGVAEIGSGRAELGCVRRERARYGWRRRIGRMVAGIDITVGIGGSQTDVLSRLAVLIAIDTSSQRVMASVIRAHSTLPS